MPDKIIVDLWGGTLSTVHVARFITNFESAAKIAREALSEGFLVNLRSEVAWGTYAEFDNRQRLTH